MTSKSKSKSYSNFGMFLKRQKNIKKSHCLVKLILNKFVLNSNKKFYQYIDLDTLKEFKVFEEGQYFNLGVWRQEMRKKGILLCEANNKELRESKPNPKANFYKVGESIKKYVDMAILELLPDRVIVLEEKIDSKADNSRVEALETKVEELSNKVDGIITFVLKANPPDTPKRRKIVGENFINYDKCLELLKATN